MEEPPLPERVHPKSESLQARLRGGGRLKNSRYIKGVQKVQMFKVPSKC